MISEGMSPLTTSDWVEVRLVLTNKYAVVEAHRQVPSTTMHFRQDYFYDIVKGRSQWVEKKS